MVEWLKWLSSGDRCSSIPLSLFSRSYPLNRMETRITSYTLATLHTLSQSHIILLCSPCSITHRIEYCVHTHQSLIVPLLFTHTHTHSHIQYYCSHLPPYCVHTHQSLIVHTHTFTHIVLLFTLTPLLCAHSPHGPLSCVHTHQFYQFRNWKLEIKIGHIFKHYIAWYYNMSTNR
jgi:hypothetical protein